MQWIDLSAFDTLPGRSRRRVSVFRRVPPPRGRALELRAAEIHPHADLIARLPGRYGTAPKGSAQPVIGSRPAGSALTGSGPSRARERRSAAALLRTDRRGVGGAKPIPTPGPLEIHLVVGGAHGMTFRGPRTPGTLHHLADLTGICWFLRGGRLRLRHAPASKVPTDHAGTTAVRRVADATIWMIPARTVRIPPTTIRMPP